jgi:hypothetical protein
VFFIQVNLAYHHRAFCGYYDIIPLGGLLVSKDLLFHQLSWWFSSPKATNKKSITLENESC